MYVGRKCYRKDFENKLVDAHVLRRHLVLDEADKMLSMGFGASVRVLRHVAIFRRPERTPAPRAESQVRSIITQVRPDRQGAPDTQLLESRMDHHFRSSYIPSRRSQITGSTGSIVNHIACDQLIQLYNSLCGALPPTRE